ncbi:hypothetical protein GCM10025874_22220 [Arenivirga flava]|uniref:DUF2470 domain-containing protein n=2 Tax=Arenivirga flava TaxID=1930060 RepID=A0AA37UHE9_9MICO|nr:hypothetical protein GCM10025874_22220 [Arenivirga flava]
MLMAMPHTFEPQVVDAVLHHMNDDHHDDSLLIARAFGAPDAERSVMTALDGDGGTWLVTESGEQRELRVAWSQPITERPEIRREVVVLYDRACAALGIEPRPH